MITEIIEYKIKDDTDEEKFFAEAKGYDTHTTYLLYWNR